MDCSRRNHPAALRVGPDSGECIGYHVTENRFSRMTCPPPDDVTAQPRLAENIPESFAFARCAGIRPGAAVFGIRFDKTVNAVLVRVFSSGGGVPEHRR